MKQIPEESKVMQEIRRIRAEISDEIKDLSPSEQVAKAKREAEAFEKEFGLKLRRLGENSEKSA